MPKANTKLKIDTRGKFYAHTDSPLYKLRTKRRLAEVLNQPFQALQALRSDQGNYKEFEDTSGGKARKIQQPARNLDVVHTRIASLLCRIDTPDYLHSGKRGLSNVTNAEAHIDSQNVLTTDIRSFFPSTTRKMVFSFFYGFMKCAADVADLLADLCTIHSHIPTGSRLSMPLAFWANHTMFNELNELSIKHNVKMTVYVDDLTFSGEAVNRLFSSCARKIISKYSHCMHPDKTKLYGSKSPKLITGVIVQGASLKVRNQQHQYLLSEMAQWLSIKDSPNALHLSITNRMLGRLYSMSVIDKRYRAKAKMVRNSTTP
ncbi:reverse transcriptase family protein [Vibrio fluvialis]|uniref:reverse transcriptase family protein n=1 Tax=Vibrio fluvialis TaxID=676 RepID=UPI000509D7F5|nr:reverse transcriptase family protein [Vibrio fluvialis]